MSGTCVGLHPYGPCAPGEGCNVPADPTSLQIQELRAQVAHLTALLDQRDGRIRALINQRAKALRLCDGPELMYTDDIRRALGAAS